MKQKKLTATEIVTKSTQVATAVALAGTGFYQMMDGVRNSVYEYPDLVEMLHNANPAYIDESINDQHNQLLALNDQLMSGKITIDQFSREYKKITGEDFIYTWAENSANPDIKTIYNDFSVKSEDVLNKSSKKVCTGALYVLGAPIASGFIQILSHIISKRKNKRNNKITTTDNITTDNEKECVRRARQTGAMKIDLFADDSVSYDPDSTENINTQNQDACVQRAIDLECEY